MRIILKNSMTGSFIDDSMMTLAPREKQQQLR
jgi:hypothetical protein